MIRFRGHDGQMRAFRTAFTILDSRPLRLALLYAAGLPVSFPLLPIDPKPHRDRELVGMVLDGIAVGLRAAHGH